MESSKTSRQVRAHVLNKNMALPLSTYPAVHESTGQPQPGAAASLTMMPSGKWVTWKSLEEVGRTAAVDPFSVSAQSPHDTAQHSH